jgi:hypothetical protein
VVANGLNPTADSAQFRDTTIALGISAEGQALREATKPNFIERVGAAMSGNTDARIVKGFGRLLSGYSSEFDDVAELDYQAPKEALVGVAERDLQERYEARSRQELDAIIGRQTDEQQRVQDLMSGGVVSGMALGFAAEILSVSNFAAGFGAARFATIGELANTSRLGVIGDTIKINLAQGTAIEGTAQLLEQRFDPANLAIAAVMDTALGAGFGHLQYSSLVGRLDAQRAIEEGVTHEAATLERAQANLPADATPAQVEAEYQRIIHKDMADTVNEAITPTGRGRKLMDHPEDDVVEEIADAVEAPATTSSRGLETVETASPDDWQFKTLDEVGETWASGRVRWENPATGQTKVARANGPDRAGYDDITNKITGGELKTYKEVTDLPLGVYVTKAVRENGQMSKSVAALKELADEYLGKASRVVFGDGTMRGNENGVVASVGNTHIIGVTPMLRPGETIGSLPTRISHATFHELGHAIVHQHLKSAPADMLERINQDYLEFVNLAVKGDPVAVERRFSMTNASSEQLQLKTTDYNINRDEWMAEQYVKHLQTRLVNGELGKLSKGVVQTVIDGIRSVIDFFIKSKARGLIEPSTGMDEFFKFVMARGVANNKALRGAVAEAPATSSATAARTSLAVNVATDPIAVKYGLTRLPQTTLAEKAKAKAMLNVYRKADAWAIAHPKDAAWDARVKNLVDNPMFNAASTSLNMLKSNNPVVRMIASELLEDPSGAAGARKSTAALSKHLLERSFMGNSINDVQNAYALWGKQFGSTLKDDYFEGGKLYARFNREIAEEIEYRRVTGQPTSKNPHVIKAADSLEAGYERMRKSQIAERTLGWAGMPGTSRGYMPHKISPSKWRAASNEQRMVIRDALAEQYVNIEGWDAKFSGELADKVLERVHARANGGHDSPLGGASAASAEIVEDALLTMGMTADEVRANMQRFNKGAAGWTKARIDLDLNRAYTVGGKDYKLLDIFDTDQLSLMRSQAGRASGEVALARHGVYGKPGLQTLREAMTYGESGARATDVELGAFDQVSAEFINAPFGDAGPKWMENARVLNSVVRLGGIAFNQFAEFANAIAHIGVVRTFRALKDFPRLRKEIKALAEGKQAGNHWLDSMEKIGGAQFGTDAYKIIMPFDSMDHAYPTYGRDSLTTVDRLLRGASHAQAKLSLWRSIHSMQQRGMAEQITAKIARYVRDGTDDVALQQFGITPQVRAALKKDLNNVAKWDGDSLIEFDVTKMTDLDMQEELIQSVHRGVSQIIQGTFIGETGKWAHDGYLKVLTQFRTFSITSMEKQWARQRNSRGTAQALGIMLGSMSVVAPVYVARVYASSLGMSSADRDEFLERRLAPEMIARQTMNYIAMSGLVGDFLDIGASVAPEAWGLGMTGGRAGTDTKFVGNVVAPSLSLVDDVWKGLQNLDDAEKIAKIMPGSRLPFLLPAVNALGD